LNVDRRSLAIDRATALSEGDQSNATGGEISGGNR